MKLRFTHLASTLAAVLMLSACGGGEGPLDTTTGDKAAPADSIVVGSANFPENVLLAEIYAAALQAKSVKVSKKLNIGSREVYLPALQDGSIDLLPEYNGALLSYLKKGETTKETDSEAVYTAVKAVLPQGIVALEQSTAEDKDAVVVTQATAGKHNLKSIEDLKPVAGQLVLGGPPEWRDRFTGVPGLKQLYGLTFKQFKPLDVAGPLTVKALKDGTVDAANLFTTQSAIAANNFVVLDDPKNLFLAENVVPVVRESKASQTVKDALNAVSGKLTTDNLTEMVKRVEIDKDDAATVAKDFLQQNGLS
jgi:osmoprotectant transport system substrate-binding protein